MITIDGSYGEGGGQILRTSLALSLVTGQPFRIEKIRAGRKKPGLMRQHLTAVNAAVEVGAARVSGNTIGSQTLFFEPQGIRSGRFHWAIGTAGSCTLVLQAILPALMIAEGPSKITLEGGTHNPHAPPFDFLAQAFLPLIARMGPRIMAQLERPGFFPGGGGRLRVTVNPASSLQPLEMLERGAIRRQTVRALVSHLPLHIARRELNVVGSTMRLPEDALITVSVGNAKGPGNILSVEVESDALTEIFTGFGQRGIPAEKVAGRTVSQVSDYLSANVPVGRHLADQLLVPMAIAGGGAFLTLPPSRHTLTNIDIIRHFMQLSVDINENAQGQWLLRLETSG
jgi:RNA 3'-terminal phosphate cyclase (ATP)